MGINRGNCWIGAVHRSSQGVGARTRFQYPRRPKKPKPTPDTHHREVPVHVTRQVARSVDAEAPPSNRRPAITPPPGGNGGDKRPGSGDRDHPYGNGSGGDKNGEGGDGNGSGSVELSVSGLERRGIGEKFTFCVSGIP